MGFKGVKKTSLMYLGVFFVLISVCVASYNYFSSKNIKLYAKGAIALSVGDDKVLYEKNMDNRFHPASMTKLMSMLIVFDKIDEGSLSYEDKIYVSKRAVDSFAKKAGLKEGESLNVDSMLKCVFLPSGSDATIALAEHISGSEERFVLEMNEKAKGLGLENTQFSNCVGLEENGHYSSPYDMAKIAKELVTKYPEVYNYTSLKNAVVEHEDRTKLMLENTNDMLEHGGVNGLKTGSGPEGGYNLTFTYQYKKKHIIFVVMGNERPYFRKQDCELLLNTFK